MMAPYFLYKLKLRLIPERRIVIKPHWYAGEEFQNHAMKIIQAF